MPRRTSVGASFAPSKTRIQLKAILSSDCGRLNIMMDATRLFPKLYHPQKPVMDLQYDELAEHRTRTEIPVKYYLIDFGISRRYDPNNKPPLELPIRGGDKSVPEIANATGPIDPFPSDVYYLGNVIRTRILAVRIINSFARLLQRS